MMIRPEIGGDLQRGPGMEGAGRRWERPNGSVSAFRCSAGRGRSPGFPLAAQSTSISLGNVSI